MPGAAERGRARPIPDAARSPSRPRSVEPVDVEMHMGFIEVNHRHGKLTRPASSRRPFSNPIAISKAFLHSAIWAASPRASALVIGKGNHRGVECVRVDCERTVSPGALLLRSSDLSVEGAPPRLRCRPSPRARSGARDRTMRRSCPRSQSVRAGPRRRHVLEARKALPRRLVDDLLWPSIHRLAHCAGLSGPALTIAFGKRPCVTRFRCGELVKTLHCLVLLVLLRRGGIRDQTGNKGKTEAGRNRQTTTLGGRPAGAARKRCRDRLCGIHETPPSGLGIRAGPSGASLP